MSAKRPVEGRLAKDETEWVDRNPIRAARTVPLRSRAEIRRNPARLYRGREVDDVTGELLWEGDRVEVCHLTKWYPGRVMSRFKACVVVTCDDEAVPPITVYDAKYLRREKE